MSALLRFELARACDILLRDLLKLKADESLIITADTESDVAVVEGVASSAYSLGAKPLVIYMPTPGGVSKAADPDLPIDALTGCLSGADCWVEFNKKWILYSTVYLKSMEANKRLRHYCLTGTTTRMMVSCIGKINYPQMFTLNDLLATMIKKASQIKMTTPAGCNIEFINYADQPILSGTGLADAPGTHFMAGQINWTPQPDSVNGTIVFDGSVAPAIGLISSPISLHVENGRVMAVEGGNEAKIFKEWMYSFNDEQMLRIAHTGLGFNPQAKLSGDLLEDQRIFGSSTWAVGSIGAALLPPNGVSAPSHSDGVCLNTSVWFDGEQVLENGQFIEPELSKLAKGLG